MTTTAGLDLSLAGTGVCVTRSNGGRYIYRFATKPTTDLNGTHRRLVTIVDWIRDVVPAESLVCIEGPSMASKFGHPHDRSGLWWLVAHMLYSRDCQVIAVPPNTRAKYATGKGNASKDAVFAQVIRTHMGLGIQSNDVADAVVLDDIANRLTGHPVDDDLPALNLTALKGIAS